MQQTIVQHPEPNVTVVTTREGGSAGENVVLVPPPVIAAGPRGNSLNQMYMMNAAVALAVLLPLSIALAIRLVRRGQRPAAALPDLSERLSRIEHAIESSALEVERIGEGQRYLTRVLASGERERANQPFA